MGKIIGIDLGTTNSCVAVMEGGQAPGHREQRGRSHDALDRGLHRATARCWSARRAKRQAVTNPQNTLFAIKRLIGRRFDDEVVQKDIDMVPYKIVKADNGDAWVEVNGKKMAPPEISAQGAAEDEEDRRGLSGRDGHRGGHHRAGLLQRLPAPGHQGRRAHRRPGRQAHHQRADRGGAGLRHGQEPRATTRSRSTTSVAAPSISPSSRSPRSTASTSSRCCPPTATPSSVARISTCASSTTWSSEFKKDQGIDLRNDPLALQRLKEAAEKAKIELSSSQQTDINLPYITADATGPKHLNIKLTRAKLEVAGRGSGRPHRRALQDRAEGRRRLQPRISTT